MIVLISLLSFPSTCNELRKSILLVKCLHIFVWKTSDSSGKRNVSIITLLAFYCCTSVKLTVYITLLKRKLITLSRYPECNCSPIGSRRDSNLNCVKDDSKIFGNKASCVLLSKTDWFIHWCINRLFDWVSNWLIIWLIERVMYNEWKSEQTMNYEQLKAESMITLCAPQKAGDVNARIVPRRRMWTIKLMI